MRRFRLSTLMLLVVIAALSVALVIQDRRAARREAELRLKHQHDHELIVAENFWFKSLVKDLRAKLDELGRSPERAGRSSDGK